MEKTIINFKENGTYDIATELLFNPPKFDPVVLRHIFNNNNAILTKFKKDIPLTKNEKKDIIQLPSTYLICSLNGFKDAKNKLELARPFLREMPDKTPYIKLKEALRILRKIKYSQ